MNFIPAKTPAIVKTLFRSYVWHIETNEKILYLTFDDGPTPIITEWVLEQLNRFNAKATFFCIGNNLETYPDIFRKIEKEGHAIGNHTFNHCRGWKTETDDYISEIQKAQKSIDSKITNQKPLMVNLFRPPYGQITPNQGKALLKNGYKIIMWDVLAFDWMDSISEEDCLNYVISKAKAGSIIVFHDSVKASKRMRYALPKVLAYFSEKGFEFRGIPG